MVKMVRKNNDLSLDTWFTSINLSNNIWTRHNNENNLKKIQLFVGEQRNFGSQSR